MEANAHTTTSNTRDAPSRDRGLAGPILDRISKLGNLKLYRRDYFLHFVLRRSPEGVRANLECRYEVCNATDERQPFMQELTVDDPDHGHVEEMSFFADEKPVYVLKRPPIAERHVGYSSYHGPKLFIERNSVGVTYNCQVSWVINRSENDLWCTHMGLPTIGVAVETHAPPEFDITRSFAVPDLIMTGEHVDIAWNRRR